MKKVMMGLAVLCMGASEVAAQNEEPRSPARTNTCLKERLNNVEIRGREKRKEERALGRQQHQRERLEEQLGDYDIVPEDDERLLALHERLVAAGLAPRQRQNQENEANN